MEFEFDNEQKDEIRLELQKYPPEQVEKFITEVESALRLRKLFLPIQSVSKHCKELDEAINHFEKTLWYVEMMGMGKFCPFQVVHFDATKDREFLNILASFKRQKKLVPLAIPPFFQILELLKEAKGYMERYKLNKHRPEAIPDGLIETLAELYEGCFEKRPTQYEGGRHLYQGTFYEVTKTILYALGIDWSLRAFKRAIKKGKKNSQ